MCERRSPTAIRLRMRLRRRLAVAELHRIAGAVEASQPQGRGHADFSAASGVDQAQQRPADSRRIHRRPFRAIPPRRQRARAPRRAPDRSWCAPGPPGPGSVPAAIPGSGRGSRRVRSGRCCCWWPAPPDGGSGAAASPDWPSARRSPASRSRFSSSIRCWSSLGDGVARLEAIPDLGDPLQAAVQFAGDGRVFATHDHAGHAHGGATCSRVATSVSTVTAGWAEPGQIAGNQYASRAIVLFHSQRLQDTASGGRFQLGSVRGVVAWTATFFRGPCAAGRAAGTG